MAFYFGPQHALINRVGCPPPIPAPRCSGCEGEGYIDCGDCGGEGFTCYATDDDPMADDEHACAECGGKGRLPCQECG
jgi:hypothetical protein